MFSVCTCVNTQQPGANEWGKRLARFGQQGNHAEEECRGGLLASVDHEVLVHQIGNDQFQQLARPLCKHPVARRKRGQVTVFSPQQKTSSCNVLRAVSEEGHGSSSWPNRVGLGVPVCAKPHHNVWSLNLRTCGQYVAYVSMHSHSSLLPQQWHRGSAAERSRSHSIPVVR